jgi:hypothetical protein
VTNEPDSEDAAEVVDGVPVPAGPPPALEPARPAQVPVVHAAALAATGFVAGAATAAVVSRRRLRRISPFAGPRRGLLGRRRRRKGTVGEIVSSNSFLVDVHLIRRD